MVDLGQKVEAIPPFIIIVTKNTLGDDGLKTIKSRINFDFFYSIELNTLSYLALTYILILFF
jgi:hypothetical protein